VKISIPFGYYRGEVSPKTTRPAVVEFIDADAPVISAADAPVAAEWKKWLRNNDDWDLAPCRYFQGDFLVPVGSGPNTIVTVDDLPIPSKRVSSKAFVLMALMPMSIGEPIYKECMQALFTGEDRWGGLDVSEAGYDRAGRIKRASTIATSFVVIDGAVWRKVPEPKLKLEVSGRFARLAVYFGGIHWSESGKHNSPGLYILPLTAGEAVRDLAESDGIHLNDGDVVERVHFPELFTFRASASLTEVLARRVVSGLKEQVGMLDRGDAVRWAELREMSEGVGRLDNSFGHDTRGVFPHREMLDIIVKLSRSVRDCDARRNIEMVAGWAQTFEQETTYRAAPAPVSMGGPRR
jgi:hypothetical protein